MKEDVKNIKELLQGAKDTGIYDDNKYLYSVENLLKRYEELKEVVNKYGGEQELEKYITELSRFLGNVSIDAMLGTIKREFIPISVIQEKLNKDKKEFDKMKKEKPSKIKYLIINQKYARIMAFKELLEEGRK